MDTKVLGARIQFYREQANLTQVELAEIVGCTPQHISAIERGDKAPKLKTFADIGKALRVPTSILLDDWVADLGEMWEKEVDLALQIVPPDWRAFLKHKLTLNLPELMGQKKPKD